jgi:DNA-3-methyladenine glycosylase II
MPSVGRPRSQPHRPSAKPAFWDEATRSLGERDAVMARLVAAFPGIHLVRRGDPFTTLTRAIVGQQISVKAAQTVWDRLVVATDGAGTPIRLDPVRIGRTRMPTLRRVGLSRGKALYIRDLARHFVSGALDPREWPALADEDLIDRLTEVKGIGRWTAEMFLMFHELRPDVLPVADIGLQKAVAMLYHGGVRLPMGELREFAAMWSPWRSVATWYLWRSLDPIPIEY